ncbi:MAG TPA: DUF2058 domain-containing protein [Methylomicrobium sp.]|nr:DUF2058 domain-containing protein [Methylomicrobium sp.]
MSQKKLSLQEQLLKSGLVTTAQARTVKSEKHKQVQQQRHNNVQVVDEAKRLMQQALAEKAERDKELNKLKQQQEERKQIAAQVRQLIENNRIAIDESEIEEYDDSQAYHFTDQNKVKKLFVPKAMRDQISNGTLAIVRLRKRYELVPVDIAQKIRERDPVCVIVWNDVSASSIQNNDDPYAQYQIPDDLIW